MKTKRPKSPASRGRELKRLLAVRLVPAHQSPASRGRELKHLYAGRSVFAAVARLARA